MLIQDQEEHIVRYCLCLLLISAFLVECASTTGKESTRGSRYVITAEEITESSATSAYEAIQILRPGLLNRDQRRSIDMWGRTEVVVYVDGIRYGNKESLKAISASQIAEIKYLTGSEATMRFGSDHAGGAFLIKLK